MEPHWNRFVKKIRRFYLFQRPFCYRTVEIQKTSTYCRCLCLLLPLFQRLMLLLWNSTFRIMVFSSAGLWACIWTPYHYGSGGPLLGCSRFACIVSNKIERISGNSQLLARMWQNALPIRSKVNTVFSSTVYASAIDWNCHFVMMNWKDASRLQIWVKTRLIINRPRRVPGLE